MVAIALSLLLAEGCALLFDADESARAVAPEIQVGTDREDTLHCKRGECSNWYRLVIDSQADVVISANAPTHPALPDFSMTLRSRGLNLLGRDAEPLERPREISKNLIAGVYFVHIESLNKHDDRLSYKLAVKRKPRRRTPTRRPEPRTTPSQPERPDSTRPPPPPPPPTVPEYIETELLEVERDGGEPVAVLLEAGTGQGIRRGMRGELVEGGKVIAKLEVVAVYAAGSRAKILGGLAAPITLDTGARIRK